MGCLSADFVDSFIWPRSLCRPIKDISFRFLGSIPGKPDPLITLSLSFQCHVKCRCSAEFRFRGDSIYFFSVDILVSGNFIAIVRIRFQPFVQKAAAAGRGNGSDFLIFSSKTRGSVNIIALCRRCRRPGNLDTANPLIF